MNAEYDYLRASGEAFSAAFAVASVDVRQVQVKTMLHGFLNLPCSLGPGQRRRRPYRQDRRRGEGTSSRMTAAESAELEVGVPAV